jgi:phosphopantetheine adenylyltransferase
MDDAASFLLLFPPPPSPPTIPALKELYADTLTQVLKEADLASKESVQPSILDIALAIPHLTAQAAIPRTELYAPTQTILAAVYKLICLIAAQEHINVEDADGVDVRILPIAWSPQSSFDASAHPSSYGPVLDLQSLAASGRPWQYAFGVENDQGEVFVRAFVAAKQAAANHQCDCHPTSGASRPSTTPRLSAKEHHHVAVGGTFDHLHIGHKLLLTMTAFALDQTKAESVLTIGITGDELLKNKKYAEQLESWSARQTSVHRFLDAILSFAPADAADPVVEEVKNSGPNGHAVNIKYPNGLSVRCVEIWDPFGPTITEKEISALIISAETRAGGSAVNDKRTENGWPKLDVLEVDVLDSTETSSASSQQNFEGKLSSTEIRKKHAQKTASSL